MSEEFKRGHCLHCDLAAAVNAWAASRTMKSSDVVESIIGVLAHTIVAGAQPGKESDALRLTVAMLALKAGTLARERGEGAEMASAHAPGHT